MMLSTQRTIQKVVSKIISRRFRHLCESNNSVFSGNYSKPRMVLFSILKSCLSKQVSNSVDLVDEKILELEQEIKKVIFEIGAVEKKIANIEKKIENVEVNIEIAQSSNNQREVDYWRNEKTQLRGKEDKLLNEKAQLRGKEDKLRNEKAQLRDKEKELREKESLDIAAAKNYIRADNCMAVLRNRGWIPDTILPASNLVGIGGQSRSECSLLNREAAIDTLRKITHSRLLNRREEDKELHPHVICMSAPGAGKSRLADI